MLLTIPAVADRLSVDRSTVYREIQDGRLPVTRIRGAVRISEESLAAYVAAQTSTAQNPIRTVAHGDTTCTTESINGRTRLTGGLRTRTAAAVLDRVGQDDATHSRIAMK